MSQKIAVVITHGIGKQDPNFADGMARELKDRFAREIGNEIKDPASDLAILPVYWAPCSKAPKRSCGEWVNFHDEDDVIGYPLKTLNAAYRKVIKADRQINAGGLLSSWNPASHLGYWTDNDVTKPIAQELVRTWRAVNP